MATKHEEACVDTLVAARLLVKTKKAAAAGKRTEEDVQEARNEFLDALAEAMTQDPSVTEYVVGGN